MSALISRERPDSADAIALITELEAHHALKVRENCREPFLSSFSGSVWEEGDEQATPK